MRKALHIAGCIVLVLAGVSFAATTSIWPLAWCGGFPLAYAGAYGIYKAIKTKESVA